MNQKNSDIFVLDEWNDACLTNQARNQINELEDALLLSRNTLESLIAAWMKKCNTNDELFRIHKLFAYLCGKHFIDPDIILVLSRLFLYRLEEIHDERQQN